MFPINFFFFLQMNARVKFKELSPLEEEVGLNEEYADSTVGFDGSSNTSESLYAENMIRPAPMRLIVLRVLPLVI